ncbi:NADH dehydrogenase [ubiquinone] 1 alpha subcomplex subunit 1 [Contarinia nasturtii]|uniref:NADH dehydrogenase [ubiquinone] 1 alpha subcomplex subunit 1 n=1 Tax=Contarinia nasturtii TaxID=265458 RepID=UPI0012D41CBB|nr:NADH dehydrogenase [ubiquinone] 1 alpha subcomplex subunit 1 [Contarinia nasturtii]
MWYECIPSYAIMTICMSMPNVVLYGLNKLTQNGNAYSRCADERWDRFFIARDRAHTGSEYVCNGLETIPDEPQKK